MFFGQYCYLVYSVSPYIIITCSNLYNSTAAVMYCNFSLCSVDLFFQTFNKFTFNCVISFLIFFFFIITGIKYKVH